MNDPVPPPAPSFKRTTDNRTWSSHSREGSKPYFSFHCLSGGLSKVHIPSSANRAGAKIKQNTMTIMMESFFIDWLRISTARGTEKSCAETVYGLLFFVEDLQYLGQVGDNKKPAQ